MANVIMVLCDGLRYDTAVEIMGYLEHLVEKKLATRYYVQGELPSISRPMYETIHTGTPVSIHGITSNRVVRQSHLPNIFSVARENERKTAASANFWFSELYNGSPYVPGRDKECENAALNIQYGRFYTIDAMPDEEIFDSGQILLSKFHPDYLLIHPIGMDWNGHIYGPESNQYRNNALLIDTILATYLPGWLEENYTVLVTSDHGMARNNSHNGTLPESRDIPLYIIQPQKPTDQSPEKTASMLSIAPTVLKIMSLPIPTTMEMPPII